MADNARDEGNAFAGRTGAGWNVTVTLTPEQVADLVGGRSVDVEIAEDDNAGDDLVDSSGEFHGVSTITINPPS